MPLSNPIFRRISRLADEQGVQAFVVGGYVRDHYLRRPSTDIDVVVVGSGIALAEALARELKAKVSVFKTFGTAMVRARNVEVEFVGARRESYTRDSRKPEVEPGTLADDQRRRDFTINAMAWSLNGATFGELVDPFDGMSDLEECIIRTPCDPDVTFSDDPLRMMRAVRFASQLGFTIEEETFEAIRRNAERIRIVSRERIVTELNKIVLSPVPSMGFELLELTGLLERIFPEMHNLKGVEKRGRHAHKDNFIHTLKVVDNVARRSGDLWLRWAAVLHDIAKPLTKAYDPRVGWTFHGHEVLGSKMVPAIFRQLKLPLNEHMKFVQKLVFLHLRPIILSEDLVTDSAVRRLLFEAGDADTLARHLITLAKDPTLRQHLGERLYQRGREDFSLESTLERQLNIYETILRRQSRKKGRRDGALVCGAYGRGNAGDDAILEAIVTELRQIDPDLPIWVLSRNPDDTRLTYRVNSIYTFAFPRFLWRMRKTHLYINGGGSLMQDVTSHRSLWFYLFTISWAKRLGNQVMMYGCGIGPIHSPANRRRASRVLQKSVDAITLRDTHSAEELEDMGVTKPQVILSADPTVILPAAPAQVVDGILESQGIDPHGRYIGFALRPWPGFEAKAAVFGAAADYAYETYGLTPVFLPIERRLDVGAAQLAAQHMKAPHYILSQTGRSDHTIGLFARMQAVVSMRLHALVFSAGQGVPLVGVVYDQKISSFLSYIGQDLYTGLDEVTEEALRAHIDAACARIGDEAFLSGGVERLRQVERRNSETARMLLER